MEQTKSPTYELNSDMTGQKPIARGPTVLKDKMGNEKPVPFPPNPKCKKCYGRGYVGLDIKHGGLVLCIKCYRSTQ